jgi:hypothetical protein
MILRRSKSRRPRSAVGHKPPRRPLQCRQIEPDQRAHRPPVARPHVEYAGSHPGVDLFRRFKPVSAGRFARLRICRSRQEQGYGVDEAHPRLSRAPAFRPCAREEIAQRWPTRPAGTLFPNCPRLRLRPPYLTVWVVSAPRARESCARVVNADSRCHWRWS